MAVQQDSSLSAIERKAAEAADIALHEAEKLAVEALGGEMP